MKQDIKKLQTWGKQSVFEYEGSVTKGTTIYMGKNFSSKLAISKETYEEMLQEFEGKTLPIGTSRTEPAEDSLGKWIEDNSGKVGTTSFVGAILIEEGYAEKEGSSINFLKTQK